MSVHCVACEQRSQLCAWDSLTQLVLQAGITTLCTRFPHPATATPTFTSYWRVKRALLGSWMGNFVLLCIAIFGCMLYLPYIRVWGKYADNFTDSTGYGRLGGFASDLEMVIGEE